MTYALNKFGLAFATFASLFSWILLDKREELVSLVRQVRQARWLPSKRSSDTNGEKEIENERFSHHIDVPLWWYGVATLLGLFFAIFACEYYPVQIRWYGAILAFVISAIFYLPVSSLRFIMPYPALSSFNANVVETDFLGFCDNKHQN